MSIPRIIHRIWIGSPPTDQQIANLLDARQHIQGHVELWLWTNRSNRPRLPFTVDKNIVLRDLDTLWTECSIPSVSLARLHSAFERERHGYYHNYAAASDIARLLILYRYGGIYLDMDVSFREGASDLFGELNDLGQRLGMFTNGLNRYNNNVLAAVPRAQALEKCLSEIVRIYHCMEVTWSQKRSFDNDGWYRHFGTVEMTGPAIIKNILKPRGPVIYNMIRNILSRHFDEIDASGDYFKMRPEFKRRDSLP